MRANLAIVAAVATFLSASLARADAPVVDHAFAFYDIAWSGVSSTSGTNDPKSEWYLKASYRVWGEFPDRTILKYFVKKSGKSLGEVRCQTRTRHQPLLHSGLPHLFAEGCADRKLLVQDAGDFQVEWHLINGDNDADTTLGTDTFTVRAAPRYDVGQNLRPTYPIMYVDRNAELLSAVAYHRPDMVPVYLDLDSTKINDKRGDGIDLIVPAAPSYASGDVVDGSHVRCTVDGAKVDLKTPWSTGSSNGTRSDEVKVTSLRGILAEAETPNPGGNPLVNKDPILFRSYYLQLPLTFSGKRERNEATTIAGRAGKWECEWRNGQLKTLRTFRFNVGADGRIERHAEQTQHGLSLAPGASFIEMVIPKDDPLDARTQPSSLASGAFNGRGLKSASVLAIAKTVPSLGNPLPPKLQIVANDTNTATKKKLK
jgi:hypothetical protein